MSKKKTYKTAEERWVRTIELFMRSWEFEFDEKNRFGEYPQLSGFKRGWHIAKFLRSHKYFCPNDVVIFVATNGNTERWPIWGFSSKGRGVSEFYSRVQDYNHGLMAGIHAVPDHLVGVRPDDPALREYVIALAHEGCRMPGKCE